MEAPHRYPHITQFLNALANYSLYFKHSVLDGETKSTEVHWKFSFIKKNQVIKQVSNWILNTDKMKNCVATVLQKVGIQLFVVNLQTWKDMELCNHIFNQLLGSLLRMTKSVLHKWILHIHIAYLKNNLITTTLLQDLLYLLLAYMHRGKWCANCRPHVILHNLVLSFPNISKSHC